MEILLLGGTGIISSDVLNLCLARGHKVTIFNRGNNNIGISSNVNIIIGDHKDLTQKNKIFDNKNFDVVVDFLSRKPKDIACLFHLLKDRTRQYIFISTACVYMREDNQNQIITEESLKPNYNWSYSVEKYECEEILKLEARKHNILYTIVRPYITYSKTRIPFGLTPSVNFHWTIIARIMSGKPLFVWDDGEALSTFTHSTDFAKGILGLFDNSKAFNEDFHITSNEVCSWNQMLKILFESLGRDVDIVKIPTDVIAKKNPEYREILLEDRKHNAIFDNTKILDAVPELEFNCSLKEGINKNINYYLLLGSKEVDYPYDAKIDKLTSKYSNRKLKYVDYLNENNKKNYIEYHLFRIFNQRFARYMLKGLFKMKLVDA